MERGQRGDAAELSEMQAAAWRVVNAELVQQLSSMLDAPHTRHLVLNARRLRDRFFADLREGESHLNAQHRELILCAERGDFIRAAVLSRNLVSSKAKAQANNAAFTELEEALRGVGSVKEGAAWDSDDREGMGGSDSETPVSLHATSLHSAIATSLRSLGDISGSLSASQTRGIPTEGVAGSVRRPEESDAVRYPVGSRGAEANDSSQAPDARSPINRKVVRERFAGEAKVIPLRRRSL
jgi:hypothetical protein